MFGAINRVKCSYSQHFYKFDFRNKNLKIQLTKIMKSIQIQTFYAILLILGCFYFFEISSAPTRNRTRSTKKKTTATTATTLLTTVSPCDNVTCHNDGVCVVLGNDRWVCACKDGFVGDNCETEYSHYLVQLTSSRSSTTEEPEELEELEEPSPCDSIVCPGGTFCFLI